MAGKGVYRQGGSGGDLFAQRVQMIYDGDIKDPTQVSNLLVASGMMSETDVEMSGLSRLADRVADIGLHNGGFDAGDSAVLMLDMIGKRQDPAAALQGLTKIARNTRCGATAAHAIDDAASLLERNPSLVSAKVYTELTQVKAREEQDGLVARFRRIFSRAARPVDPVDEAVRNLNKVVKNINGVSWRMGAGHGW